MRAFGDPALFGDLYASEYDQTDYRDPGPAVGFLTGLVPEGGRVLELAIGTGRVAVPLAERGIAVEGVEGSAAMVRRLRRNARGGAPPGGCGGMAARAGAGPPYP